MPIDKCGNLWYNNLKPTRPPESVAQRSCARRRINKIKKQKRASIFNWLHSPIHFREHSVALLSRPNVHDLWRVRFRNFLTCGFYLGGLLIYLTSFLCFNYSTSWLFCQQFFYTYSAKISSSISTSVQPQTESSK